MLDEGEGLGLRSLRSFILQVANSVEAVTDESESGIKLRSVPASIGVNGLTAASARGWSPGQVHRTVYECVRSVAYDHLVTFTSLADNSAFSSNSGNSIRAGLSKGTIQAHQKSLYPPHHLVMG